MILEVEDNRSPFFMELIKNFRYVKVLQQVRDKKKSQHINDLVEAFQDVKLFEQGKKKLKSAGQLLNEL
jgi:ABC-type phosphate transport system ATPase subunit